MSENPLESKMAAPYARAIHDLYFILGDRPTRKTFMDMQRFLANLIDISDLLESNPQLVEYLDNPIFDKKAKKEILKLTVLKSIGKVSNTTSNFLMFLVDRDRINVLGSIIKQYLALLYESAGIKIYQLNTSYRWTNDQKETLRKQLITHTGSRYVILNSTVDPYSVVAGFLLKNKSTVLDFTVNNTLNQIAKYLDIQWQFNLVPALPDLSVNIAEKILDTWDEGLENGQEKLEEATARQKEMDKVVERNEKNNANLKNDNSNNEE